MVLDTSAVLAILLGEPEAPSMLAAIHDAEGLVIGAPTFLEAAAVMRARKGSGGEIALDALMERLGVEIQDFSADALRLARLGYARYVKGVGDPAVLNFGDCFSYGTAMALRSPLLFKGSDFSSTDVEVAAY
jgi:ribonuclease VapC